MILKILTSDNEAEYKNERDPWIPLKADVSRLNIAEFYEPTQNFLDCLDEEEEAKNKVYIDRPIPINVEQNPKTFIWNVYFGNEGCFNK